VSGPTVLFSAEQIDIRLRAVAHEIATLPEPAQMIAPVLVGAFVFAADLARALSREGLDLPLELLWLRSYGGARQAGDLQVLAGPDESVQGRHVLLIDGVLDHGHTLSRARELLFTAGASKVTTAVVIDKQRDTASIRADHACFTGVKDFIVGYGMDDAGLARGLPYIGKVG
jgi:hypoxanthine phosphoribosyltransferase